VKRAVRRACARGLWGLCALVGAPVQAGPACAEGWPAWSRLRAEFLSADGRLVDPASDEARTVSEAEAYALFFALVAGERGDFARVLRWSRDNLAGGDLARHLPAWRWGRAPDGHYGVLDEHSAADADLWMAYVLAQAGALWSEPAWTALAQSMAERILAEETRVLPGLGRVLLPGPVGFELGGGRWRLNPAYAPAFILAWFARDGDTRWEQLRLGSAAADRLASPGGLAPDWFVWNGARAQPDGPGSYDAIRVYLWIGLTDSGDPLQAPALRHHLPMADLVARRGSVPEKIDVQDGSAEGEAPAGFAAALQPFLRAAGRDALARRLGVDADTDGVQRYYDRALGLFSQGWQEGRYHFDAQGRLHARWHECRPATP
jgi:endoglucanase